MSRRLIILGAGGHGKVVADIAMRTGYDEILFLDDNPELKECLGLPVVGRTSETNAYEGDFFVAIGNPNTRETITNRLESQGKTVATLIHPSAVIGHDVVIDEGTVIMAGAVINPGSVIGKGCIINTCASVDHDCMIHDFAHVSVGARVVGAVEIGERTWIGAGAVIIRSIEKAGTYVGVPARKIK